MSEYETLLATLARNSASAEEGLEPAIENYRQAVDVLLVHHGGSIGHVEAAVLRDLESITAQAFYLAALQYHVAGDHAGARRALTAARRVHDITRHALE